MILFFNTADSQTDCSSGIDVIIYDKIPKQDIGVDFKVFAIAAATSI